MTKYRKELYAIQRQIESKYRSFGQKAMELIALHGLNVDDFNRKSGGPAGFFAKIASGDFSGPSDAVSEAISIKEKWYTRTSELKVVIEKLATNELIPLLKQSKEFYDQNVIQVNTSSVILKNLYTLGILIDLSRLSDSWCSENNTFLLPEAPVFLSRIIDGNDTPFIYEKAGCWFHHFMIDEFQDTSVLQWSNFKPLISNSLSQNFDNLAVGDIKQSIYRWRNSTWEILENRIGKDFLPGVINQVTLNENRRSGENIVNFNNSFFTQAALVLQEEFENRMLENNTPHEWEIQPITDLYRHLRQNPARDDRNAGYVKVQFIDTGDESDFYAQVNNEVVTILYSLLDKGYHMKDIAILTRKNKEAADLAEFLLNYSGEGRQPFSVISDEALLLESSVVLNTLISLLKHLVDPADRNNNYYLETIITNYLKGNREDFWITPEFIWDKQQIKLPEKYLELVKGFKSYSLNEITEQLIRVFDLDKYEGEMVYLMAFRDLIQEYTRNHSSNITRFIEFWDEIGSKRSVAAPAGQDALRVMTLHKSKGLEFKITIVPYCTWDLNTFDKSFLWCRSESEPFNKLPVIPITFTKKLAKTIYSEDYFRELQKQLVDNLNLMYVAFTRAREALYVFCRESKGISLGNTSSLVKKVLSNHYESGAIPKNKNEIADKSCEIIKYRQSQKTEIATRLKIAFQGNLIIDPEKNKPARPISEGRILHEIFNRISVRDDIVRAVSQMHIQGKIM
ncbi:MAG TPA: 3'-5' exonuclease, partial [Bacteroidales bacterium]|nr:3'-5' exonuclease [Bacteroidales bacterium]